MPTPDALDSEFFAFGEVIQARAASAGLKAAVVIDEQVLTYAELDAGMDRVAASLLRDGVGRGDVVGFCASTSLGYVVALLGVIRSGAAAALLSPTASRETLGRQVADCGARLVFRDRTATALADASEAAQPLSIALDGVSGDLPLESWLTGGAVDPVHVVVEPDDLFSIIYSSGTTGEPKGIEQSHRHRWNIIRRGMYPIGAVTMIATPLYSHTTLLPLFSTLASGGLVVMMPKFEARAFLQLSERHRATHTMLVPVQYQRILQEPSFAEVDLSSYRMKFSTSAPFAARLKNEVARRWPGGLIEFYGMSEGGGTCALPVHERPDKLHTVGRPLPGHDVRLIDESGLEVASGATGEIVGRSGTMMTGYHNQPALTAAVEWRDDQGRRYIRTGDLGRFDEDGFLVLQGRRKELIISGGFNIYPIDLETKLLEHEAVAEAAVIGVPSDTWGETPVGIVVLTRAGAARAEAIRDFANARLSKTQRLSEVTVVDSLPRSPIGKVLKRELRDAHCSRRA